MTRVYEVWGKFGCRWQRLETHDTEAAALRGTRAKVNCESADSLIVISREVTA